MWQRMKIKKNQNRAYIGFIAPGLILYTLFMIVPIFFAIYYSFFSWNGIGPMEFIGLDNFKKLLFDTRMSRIFFNALGNNIKYLFCVWFIITPVQLVFAYVLYIKIFAHRYLQLMLFLPYVISTSIVGFFVILIFDPNIGALNTILGDLGLASWQSAWLGDPSRSFTIFVIVVIWQCMGAGMMIFYANLKEIPQDLIDASQIDGAGELRRFFNVIIPQLAPSLTTNFVLGTIFALTMFDIPFILGGSQGGVNNSLDFVNMVFYRYAFGGSFFGETSIGFGASISVTMFVFILVILIFQTRVLKKREFDS